MKVAGPPDGQYPRDHDWHASVAAAAPELVADIDRLVDQIARHVARLPALQLLLTSRWYFEFQSSRTETEAEVGRDEVLARVMLDYFQSIIAAVRPQSVCGRSVTEEDWKSLSRRVSLLYEKLDLYVAFPILSSSPGPRPGVDSQAARLQHRLQALWLYVRGRRYYAHVPQYLEELFIPHSDLLRDAFGVNGAQFVRGFEVLLHSLTFGLRSAKEDLDRLWEEVGRARAPALPSCADVPDRLEILGSHELLRSNNDWRCRFESVRGRILGADLYDVERVTRFPPDLVEALSWSPGEEREFFGEGARRGWPLRALPVFKRPFVRVDDRSFCFHAQTVFDNLYRVVQRAVTGRGKDLQERWNRAQSEMSERVAMAYFERLLPGADTWQSVYYRTRAANGKLEWCETDGLVALDDHLFVIECRAGSFTPADPGAGFLSHLSAMSNLVSKPATQGERFLDYLSSGDSVDLFDRDHQRVGSLRKSSFRCVTVCAVSLEAFTELAARVRRLEPLGVELGDATLWSLGIDDLRLFADVFGDPMVFLHFVEERRRSFESSVLWCDDELDFLGLYLKHGRFVEYFEDRVEDGDTIVFPGVRAEIDRFFDERLLNPKLPCPLGRIRQFRFREIVEWLSGCGRPRRVRVANFLLDMSGGARKGLADAIEEELRNQPERGRALPISRHGEHCLTVFCWREPWARCDWQLAVQHALIVAFMHGDVSRLLLGLTFDSDCRLRDIECAWVDTSTVQGPLRNRLIEEAERLRAKRIVRRKAEGGKVGRNEACPCGSGRKWKRCCLRRGG